MKINCKYILRLYILCVYLSKETNTNQTDKKMTNTAKTVYIAENASKMNDSKLIEYWLSLDASDKALFDNVSDFIQSANVFK